MTRAGCLLDLTYAVTYILCALFWTLVVGWLSEVGMLPEIQFVILGGFSLVLLAVLATVGIWYLRNKHRSLWWLLVLLLPLGWLILPAACYFLYPSSEKHGSPRDLAIQKPRPK